MLRCTSGQVFHVQIHDTASLHGAFFEWDGTDTGSVLEAFRHMPEACMGSIGMKLVSKEKPILYQVGLDRRLVRQSLGDDGAGPLVANGAESERKEFGDSGSEMSSNPKSQIHNLSRHSPKATADHQSSISPSSTAHRSQSTEGRWTNNLPKVPSQITDHSISFDHTVFRDPGQGGGPLGPGPLVHAFRAVWVSGTPAADARRGLSGRGFDQLRTIRLNSALTRYRPRHARVIQGAVRGMHTPEAAWAAFEEHMLRHLTFEG
jgi:hypothetical protein